MAGSILSNAKIDASGRVLALAHHTRLCDRWIAKHRRDATPEQIVAYYEALVG